MIKYALAGSNVSKSFSKQIHEYLLKDTYDLLSFPNEKEFVRFLDNQDFKFMNITIPFKEIAAKKCHLLSENAKATNVVNLLIKKDTRLYGYNTDIRGFEYLLDRYDINVRGKNVLILGTGATSRTVNYVVTKRGAAQVKFASRNPRGVNVYGYSNIDNLCDAEIVINTTPLGNLENKDVLLLSELDKFESLTTYIDVNYPVVSNAQARLMSKKGIKTYNGLSMLVAQALNSEEVFEGIMFDNSRFDEMYLRTFKKHFNIALIGHPCSGKTTIGKELADALEMEFIAIDEYIEKYKKATIKELIETKGEQYFRELEKEAINEFANSTGKVISTGGGAILNEDNMIILKEHCLVINLYRDIENISNDELVSRPMSSNMEALLTVIENRKKFYSEYADIEVANTTIKETVEKIRGLLWKSL